jgi:hypothetical protein
MPCSSPRLPTWPYYFYDVTPDGQRFIMIVPTDNASMDQPITVVLNWRAEHAK